MTSFITKIIVYPITLLISNYLFKDIYYPYIYQTIFVGIIIAALIHLIELALLKSGFLLTTTAVEFLSIFSLIYFTQFLLPSSSVGLIGVSISSTILITVQYFINRYLLTNYSIKKFN